MRRGSIGIATIVGAILAISGFSPVQAEGATGVASIQAELDGGQVLVSGSASFVGVPFVASNDDAGDALVPGIGADIIRATITPDPGGILRFQFDIGDPPPASLGGMPETIHYTWQIKIHTSNGAAGTWRYFFVQAIRTGQAVSQGLDPVFRVAECPQLSFVSVVHCTPGTTSTVSGVMDGAIVRVDVPAAVLSIPPAGDVHIWPHLHYPSSRIGVSGAAWLNHLAAGALDQAFGWNSAFEFPRASVRLGMAPSGTPPGQVPLTHNAQLNEDGSFYGALPSSGLQSGGYVVVARACFESNNCGTASTEVII